MVRKRMVCSPQELRQQFDNLLESILLFCPGLSSNSPTTTNEALNDFPTASFSSTPSTFSMALLTTAWRFAAEPRATLIISS